MQILSITTLLAIASVVVADKTFPLTAQGGSINESVKLGDDGKFYLGKGSDVTFTLEEPSGYLTADGKYVGLEGGLQQVDKDQASKDFGVEENKLKNGPSIDNFDFYACPQSDDDYSLQSYTCNGGTKVSLITGDSFFPSSSAPADSSAAPSSVAPSSAPVSSVPATSSESSVSSSSAAVTSAIPSNSQESGAVTETTLSTAVTSVDCDSCSHQNSTSIPEASTSENGAKQLSYGAGALIFAGVALL